MAWIKICGTTILEDALAAVEAGANALGFVFAPSPRRISPRDAAAITGALPASVEKIGVVVNQSLDLLLDSGSGSRRGGTGTTFDWQEAAPMARLLGKKFLLIIAGGLDVENVAKAMRMFQPWGVDVVSGVERAPGKKDPAKLRAFIAAVRAAEATVAAPNKENAVTQK